MLLYISLILMALSIFLLFYSPRIGVCSLLLSMPIIATTWATRIMGISLIQITFALTPLILFGQLKNHSEDYPQSWRITAIIFFVINTIGLVWGPVYGTVSVQIFIQVVLVAANVFIGFFMLPSFFSTRDDFRKLLAVLLVSAIFPTIMVLYQVSTGTVWRDRSIMGLMRYEGLYHDAVACRIFVFPALLAIVIAFTGKFFRSKIFQAALLVYGALLLVVLYNLSSRAVFAIIAFWFLGLIIVTRRKALAFAGVVLLLLINTANDNFIFERIEYLISTEVSVLEGDMVEDRLLSGRGYLWREQFSIFDSFGIFAKILGAGWTTGSHNEYLRIYYMSGIIGAGLYVLCLLMLLLKIVKEFFHRRSTWMFIALMLLGTLLIDSIGVTPGNYPFYNWILWGIMGIMMFKGQEVMEPPTRIGESGFELPEQSDD